jgi:uncharacterized protein YndB with AHSA1/START domain
MAKKNKFAITRVLEAPLDLVWKAHTEPEHLSRWCGPKGFRMLAARLDLRPGGMFHYGMKSPDGQIMWGRFIYREVVPQEKLVFVMSFSDEKGGITRNPMHPTWPLEVLMTLTFTEHNGTTTLNLTGAPVNATEEERNTYDHAHEGLQHGHGEILDQLDSHLDKLQNQVPG